MTTKKNFFDILGKAIRTPKASKKSLSSIRGGKGARPAKTVSATLKQKHAGK